MNEQQQAIQRLNELIQAAIQVTREGGNLVCITLYGRQPRGPTAYLAGRGSPRGMVHSCGPEGMIVMVEAIDLMAWCSAQLHLRGVEVEVRIGEEVRDG